MANKLDGILTTLQNKLETNFINYFSFLSDTKVFVYGSGIYGRCLAKYLLTLHCVDRIEAYINDFSNGFDIEGIAVKNINECDFSGRYCVIVAIENKNAVVQKLKDRNINFHVPSEQLFNNIVYWCNRGIGNLPERIKYYHLNMLPIENRLSDFYSDDESKRVIQSRIDFYNTGDIDYLTKYPIVSTSYFDGNYFKLSDKETFIDIGAYTGDTVSELANYTANHYKKIISFEPDQRNFEDLKNNTSKYHDVVIYPYATGNQNCEVSFADNAGMGSAVSSNGGSTVKMVRLDDFIDDIPTLIKMDVEGAELETLKGSENILKKYHPKLIVCIYHKVEDLYTIPNYLKTIVPEYRLMVRQQGTGIFETLLYAEV